MAVRTVVVEREAGGVAAREFGDWRDAVAAAVDAARSGAAVGAHCAPDAVEAADRAAALAAAAPAGAVVVSDFLADLAGGDRRELGLAALGTHRLSDLGPPRPAFALVADGLAVPDRLDGLDAVPNNIRWRRAPFAGRAGLIEALVAEVQPGEVVTVVGPGGAGKTELALRVAARRARSFPGGVSVVELAPLEALDVPVAVASAVARASRPVLVVLDCCEHVVDACRTAVEELRADPAIGVLATSRRPMRIPGERVVEIPPLDDDAAVALFSSRARAAAPGLGDLDGDEVVALCRKLDGLPLAIELAARRSRVLSPVDIAAHLDRGLGVLPTADQPGQEHHRSVRAAIAWSHDLLDDSERSVFRRIGVFSGPFDLAAAEAVTGSSTETVIDVLDRLVAHSLVVADPTVATPFRMLDTIRAYAREHLAERGRDLVAARAGLLSWLVEASRLCDNRGVDRSGLYDRLDAAPADVRAAVEHACGTDPGSAVVLLGRLGGWYCDRGRIQDGRAIAERVLAVDPGDDPLATARALNAAANLAVRAGGAAEALPLYERSLALRRDRDQPSIVASVLNDLSVCYQHLGQIDEADVVLEESVELAGRGGDRWGEATARLNQGNVAAARGDFARAAAMYEEAARVYDEEHDPVAGAAARANWGMARLAEGDAAAASEVLAGAAEALLRHGARVYLPTVLDGCASAALARGNQVRAAQLWGGAAAMAARSGAAPGPASARIGSDLAEALGARRRDELAAAGAAMDDDEVVRLAWSGDPSPGPSSLEPVAPAPPSPPSVASLRLEGDSWAVSYAGRTVRVRVSKGVGYLARLLAAPTVEHHVLDLTGGIAHNRGGSPIDRDARDAYRRRIVVLREEITDAEAMGAARRADAARLELEALTAELAGAYGIHGRSRRSGDDVERARKAVTNRLRDAVRSLAKVHPELGRHLERAVRTGTYCRYDPEAPVRWDVAAS